MKESTYTVGKRRRLRNKVVLVGNAVSSKEVLTSLSSMFEVVNISPNEFKEKIENYADSLALWIHFDTYLDSSFLNSIQKIPFLISTTTGLTHISEKIQSHFGDNLISLRGRTKFLTSITATAEHAWSLIMLGNNNIFNSLSSVRGGLWQRQDHLRDKQLSSQTLGVIGFGRLGKMVANYGSAFGMKVLVYDINKEVISAAKKNNVETTNSVEELFELSDVVSIHASFLPHTEKVVTARELSKVEKATLLVNTARAGLVDERAIIDEIEARPFLRYFTDVLAFEEDGSALSDSILWQKALETERIIITPHIGGANREAMDLCERELLDFFLKKSSLEL
jgi:D-3-phosphoglycerate dehydrogenase